MHASKELCAQSRRSRGCRGTGLGFRGCRRTSDSEVQGMKQLPILWSCSVLQPQTPARLKPDLRQQPIALLISPTNPMREGAWSRCVVPWARPRPLPPCGRAWPGRIPSGSIL